MTGIETAFAIAAAKESAKPAGRLLSAVGRRRYDAINVKYTNAFQDHMDQVIRKTSSVKNLIYKDQSANIKEKYVNIEFMQNDRKVSDLSVVEGLKNGQKFIVSGTAGAGKTMFMKWCSLELISSIINHQLIPLFLELREIGIKDDTENFCEFLFKNTSSIKNKATYNQFLEGIKSGIFVIILDAVDEINNEIRDDVLKSIRKMASAMPDVGMIVSTRPEPRIESIPEFSVLKTLPMSLSQIVQVLDKVDYNNDVKQKLIAELKSGLYKKHKSFLSNPLLATIMLLTYDQTAEIPTKVTSFYKQAFETLYQRHDATKGVYKRGHYAGLPMDEYERIFSAFCYRSYANSKFEFSDGELGKLFRDAVAYCQMDVEADLVVKDSMESVCLIQKEGLDNVFAHRSFQEYFTAIFVSLYRGADVYQIIDRVAERGHSENVLEMLYEIDQEILEKNYILPKLSEWMKLVGKLNLESASGMSKFLTATFDSFDISARDGHIASYRVNNGKACMFFSRIDSIYSEARIHEYFFEDGRSSIFGDINKFIREEKSKCEVIKIIREKLRSRNREDDEFVRVDGGISRCNWLIKTEMPKRLENIRKSISALHKKISDNEVSRAKVSRDIMAPLSFD